MTKQVMTKRAFMKATLCTGVASFGVLAPAFATQTQRAGFVSMAKDANYAIIAVGLSLEGDALYSFPLLAPTKGAATHPNQAEAILIDARPGISATVFDRTTGDISATLNAGGKHHFQGGCAFSSDGKTLYTTEQSYISGEGWIGLWDATNGYKRIGEVASGGLGPEGIKVLTDGTLVIANSGVRTNVLTGIEKTNIATMTPNLTFMTAKGEITAQTTLPTSLQKQAIRHLDVDAKDRLVFTMIAEAGDKTVPYIGFKTPKSPAQIIALPSDPMTSFTSENSKAVFSTDGTQIAVVLPDRDRLHILSADDFSILLSWQYEGIESVAPRYEGGFLVSGSDGRLYALDTDSVTLVRQSRQSWVGPLSALF